MVIKASPAGPWRLSAGTDTHSAYTPAPQRVPQQHQQVNRDTVQPAITACPVTQEIALLLPRRVATPRLRTKGPVQPHTKPSHRSVHGQQSATTD